jgi:hypothetical protein
MRDKMPFLFMWFLFKKKVLLIKDNLAKRRQNKFKECVFSDLKESIQQLYFSFPFACLI